MRADTRALEAEIEGLREEIRSLRKDLRDAKDGTKLTDTIDSLKRQIADLEINKSKLTEDHEREKREVTHMVGLEKKRQEFEIDQAKRETTVSVREDNLKQDRARFEEQMKFTTDRFEKEVGYLKELMGAVLKRLPDVTATFDRKDGPAPRTTTRRAS